MLGQAARLRVQCRVRHPFQPVQDCVVPSLYPPHTVDFDGLDPPYSGVLRDQICTTYGQKVNFREGGLERHQHLRAAA